MSPFHFSTTGNETQKSGVSHCYFCNGYGDDSLCASGGPSDLTRKDCGNADFDMNYCYVSRDSGIWKRGCCEGRDKCRDVHETRTDGSTNDKVNCHSDYCNNMNPRANDATQVSKCYVCSGDADDSPCATADTSHPDMRATDCDFADQDNTYCTVERTRGSWTRACCQGILDCQERHSTQPDGSTDDQDVCRQDLCNRMDPRNSSPNEMVPLPAIVLTVVAYNLFK